MTCGLVTEKPTRDPSVCSKANTWHRAIQLAQDAETRAAIVAATASHLRRPLRHRALGNGDGVDEVKAVALRITALDPA